MKPELWRSVRTAFEAAIQLPPEARDAFLDRDVGRDTEVRAEVERLLRAEPATVGFLDPPSPESLAATGVVPALRPLSAAGTRIASYEIVRPLGYGGMGTVYEALQTNPRRTVALKVMRWSLASPTAVRRFRYESELLARLQHPGIAQIYEAGVMDEGGVETPWFAMELLAGALPIRTHAERNDLDVEQRLAMFLEVCAAVHHGHQRGVIHRDLKPGNILVNAEGHPKIIDFGIARTTDPGDDIDKPVTREGGLVGTPYYMSPEQVSGVVEVDVRSDVYSLGVVLYELLAGSFPYDLSGKTLVEKGRIICEEDPQRPSVRREGLPKELDWITLKAMAKDPDRRYGSVQELMEDLRRYRDHQPLQAGPPTTAYYVKKFIRRHRVAVVASVLVFLALVAGMTGTTVFAVEADDQRRLAEQRLEEFDYLANLVRLREAEAEAQDLTPAWPDRIGTMLHWLEHRAKPLGERVPDLRAAIQRLRDRAEPARPEQIAEWSRQHPRFAELDHLRRKLAALRRAQGVRSSKVEVEPPLLNPDDHPVEGARLAYLAHERTHPNRAVHSYGREAEGLALARLAVTRLTEDRALPGPGQLAAAHDVLAWALHANGLESEAVAAATRAVELATDIGRLRIVWSAERLREAAAAAESGLGIGQIAAVESNLAALESEVADFRRWHLASPADQFLHDTLTELVARIEGFQRIHVTDVRDRLNWAIRLRGSAAAHAGRWAEAREAIGKADGVVASELYRQHPIDLVPQPGLVPIGMNPVTGLWEFHDLRSARHPELLPTHAPDGSIAMTETTGIVFVLIPGGTFTMGAVREGTENRDRWAAADEAPLTAVTLEPFFLGRTEVTQGQWKRLTGGDNPSRFRPDYELGGTVPVDGSHPVEMVSWFDCSEVLAQFNLCLPAEAQWEYACRAGTQAIWFAGDRPMDLIDHANVLVGQRVEGEYFGTLPVASLRPNAFGLYDMYGNVGEWCRDAKLDYVVPHRPGDGLRASDVEVWPRVLRGGSFQSFARRSRSAERNAALPGERNRTTGVRACRPLLLGGFESPSGTGGASDALFGEAFWRRLAATAPLRRVEVPEATDPATHRRFSQAMSPLTVGARIVPAAGNGVIAAHGGDARGYCLLLVDWVPSFCVRAHGRLYEVKGRALAPDQSVHVAGVLDEDHRLRLLVDGAEVAQVVGSFLPSEPAEGLSIGRDSGTAVGDYADEMPFQGDISSFRLYQGVLPAAEIGSWVSAGRR